MKYLIMQHPGHNRVYYSSAYKMALAELKIASHRLSISPTDVGVENIEGIRYLALDVNEALTDEDLDMLSRLSFVFALFLLGDDDDNITLRPIGKKAYEYIDPKISSLLKYQGKTNELFTKMMVNVGLLSSDFSYKQNVSLLDPVAGRGTTLFEAAVYGFNATGIDIDPKSTHDTGIFFKQYLEGEHLKHLISQRQIAGNGKKEAIIMQEFVYARDKKELKDKSLQKKLALVNGSSQYASQFFKNNTFHLLVGDLPYGIQHGNSTVKKQATITRNPTELLEACLPDWHKVLKKGGVAVIAWNSFIVSKSRLDDVFRKHGFEVLDQAPYNEFEHMVDRSIKRDIVVAKKI